MNEATISRRALVKAAGLILGTPIIAGISACGSTGSNAAGSSSGGSAPVKGSGDGSVLVAYYSAQGHTKAVAEKIAGRMGADLFAIEPVDPYTEDDLDYNDDSSRVSREHADESLRGVSLKTVTPAGFDGYKTVLIGYPIWWGIAAWPVDGFASGNDFSGKTLIPFCTSASSPLGDSGELLAQAAGTGDWREGMRFRSSAGDNDVANWVDGLDL